MSELEALHKRMLPCTECPLSQGRIQVVPGEGPEKAQIMFIGEAPGWNEDKQGRPFVGPAGQFLEQLLEMVGLKRDDVFIGNVIKCRPPNNRDPILSEIEACRHWLDEQVALIKPKIVVTLGRYSMARYFPGESISKAHGRAYKKDGVIYFAMYHPAAALHQQSLRRTIEEDMRKLPALLAETEKVQEKTSAEDQAKQLTLF